MIAIWKIVTDDISLKFLISDENGDAGLSRFQFLIFTFVIAIRAMGIHQAGGIAFCDIAFDCGCGGGPQEVCTKLPENVGLWFASLIAFISTSNRFSIPALMHRKR